MTSFCIWVFWKYFFPYLLYRLHPISWQLHWNSIQFKFQSMYLNLLNSKCMQCHSIVSFEWNLIFTKSIQLFLINWWVDCQWCAHKCGAQVKISNLFWSLPHSAKMLKIRYVHCLGWSKETLTFCQHTIYWVLCCYFWLCWDLSTTMLNLLEKQHN